MGSSYKRAEGKTNCEGVKEQDYPAQEQSLADDGRDHGQVHGIADVTVESARHQPLGRGDGRRGADALPDELHEGVNQNQGSAHKQRPSDHA